MRRPRGNIATNSESLEGKLAGCSPNGHVEDIAADGARHGHVAVSLSRHDDARDEVRYAGTGCEERQAHHFRRYGHRVAGDVRPPDHQVRVRRDPEDRADERHGEELLPWNSSARVGWCPLRDPPRAWGFSYGDRANRRAGSTVGEVELATNFSHGGWNRGGCLPPRSATWRFIRSIVPINGKWFKYAKCVWSILISLRVVGGLERAKRKSLFYAKKECKSTRHQFCQKNS